MKRILTLLCCMVFATQYSLVSAQTTHMKMWKGGKVTITCNTTEVDSVSFETGAENGKQDLGSGAYLINGHKFIDLGLPSGLLWAETNIGATLPNEDGSYFGWGETSAGKSNFVTDTYRYVDSNSVMSKYNSTDCKVVLETTDDAAYINWGSKCRMPTKAEFEELYDSDNCTWTWFRMTSSSGAIYGHQITSKKNGNSIFLPASGFRIWDERMSHGEAGNYWSCTLSSSDSNNAVDFSIGSSGLSDRKSVV